MEQISQKKLRTNWKNRHLLVMHGLPGSGKTSIAVWLANYLHVTYISADRYWCEQKLDPHSLENRATIYAKLFKVVSIYLLGNKSVILDCTSRNREFRAFLRFIAKTTKTDVTFILCKASMRTLRERMQQRYISLPKHPGIGAQHLQTIKGSFQTFSKDEEAHWIELDTNSTSPRVVRFSRSHCQIEEDLNQVFSKVPSLEGIYTVFPQRNKEKMSVKNQNLLLKTHEWEKIEWELSKFVSSFFSEVASKKLQGSLHDNNKKPLK